MSLFRLQNVKLMMATFNNLLMSSSNVGNFKTIDILYDYFAITSMETILSKVISNTPSN